MKKVQTVKMVEMIVAKRTGREHTRQETDAIVHGIMDGSIPDYQLAAWLMAVCLKGMSIDETTNLTEAMCRSGKVLDLSSVGPIVGDKHSTGGVGDKTTLVLVPLLAAAGIPMAKLSGRGLGHTGGTIDKLESIPGFRTNLTTEEFIQQVKEIGMAISSQTHELAPADGKMYALRDVTGTVDSIPLIAASIMSKKLAAGANLIILDVKCGRGAFMDTVQKAKDLAQTMVDVGRRLKCPVTAVVTDMEQPLGCAVGHSLEVIEAVHTLAGKGPKDLEELCLSLGAIALMLAGKCKTEEQAKSELQSLLTNGKALNFFKQLIEAQGGDSRIINTFDLMPAARYEFDLLVPGLGKKWIKHLDGRKVAEACKFMGAGRVKKGDPINLAVGIVLKGKVGTELHGGESVATVHIDDQSSFDIVQALLYDAIVFSQEPVEAPQLIKEIIT